MGRSRPGRPVAPPALASEGAASYDADDDRFTTPDDDEAASALDAAVDVLTAKSVDELTDGALRAQLQIVDLAMRRLDARRCRLTAAIVEREAQRARTANPQDQRAGEKAERRTQSELGDALKWSPGDAKRATKVGKQARNTPEVGAALDDGNLTPRHAELLADTLRWLEGDEAADAERRLVRAAQHEDTTTFGRTCRRLLAQLDHVAATQAQQRRHGRRALKVWDTDDGMTRLSGQLTGLDAEAVKTAIYTFRRPDAPNEHRQAEQATADALTDALAAALRTDEAPRRYGIPTQVVVTVTQESLDRGDGVAETRWTGPLPFDEVARAIDDCQASRLVLNAKGLPVEASAGVRTVPAAVWRGLVHRDDGCIAQGCDLPAEWCQVMHLKAPFRFGGRLSFGNAALGCPYHHRHFDKGKMELRWEGDRPQLTWRQNRTVDTSNDAPRRAPP